jgi:hypothetical protein
MSLNQRRVTNARSGANITSSRARTVNRTSAPPPSPHPAIRSEMCESRGLERLFELPPGL